MTDPLACLDQLPDAEFLALLGPDWGRMTPLQKAQYGAPKTFQACPNSKLEWSKDELLRIGRDLEYFEGRWRRGIGQ